MSNTTVGLVQHQLNQHLGISLVVDGYWGPQTANAYDKLRQILASSNTPTPTHNWPDGSTQSMIDYYGPVGTNQVSVKIPYTVKIAWDLNRRLDEFTCHKLVADSVQLAMEETLEVYGLDGIEQLGLDLWGGCYNVRKQRGGRSWSKHAFGAAIDWDPIRNRLKWGATKAELAKPVYNPFWKAWERQGWSSMGRAKGYDYMHVQAAGIS